MVKSNLRNRLMPTMVALLFLANNAYAIEPFDSLKDGVNDIIARAEQAGDALIKSLGEQMLVTIEAMEASASQLIAEGRDAALVIEGELFKDISTTIERLEKNEKILMADLTRQTANWASLVSRLPFTDGRAEVMMYRPRVLAANGPAVVPLSVVGPRIADAEPNMLMGDSDLPLSAQTDTELVAQLPRSAFEFPESEPGFATVSLTFDASPPSTWWKLWTWLGSETVERELTFMLLPKSLATYRIETVLNVSTTERKFHETTTNTRGKDSVVKVGVPVTPVDMAAGWRIDTTAALAGDYEYVHISNDGGSSCSGLENDTLTPTTAIFLTQIGHVNKWGGGSSDGWVNCRVKLPLIRTVASTSAGPTLEGTISATDDVSPELPKDLRGYTIQLRLFTGQSFIVKEGLGVPHGILEVEHSTSGIHFRPKPPSDF